MFDDLKSLLARCGDTLLRDAVGMVALTVMLVTVLHLPGAI